MLFAANRSGVTLCHSLGRTDAPGITELLRSRLLSDSALAPDANPCYAAVAKELEVMHEMVNQPAGEHAQGAVYTFRHSTRRLQQP